MSDRVVIDGDMSLTSTIDGEGSAVIRLGRNPVIEPLEVTGNGTYEVPDGVDGFNPVRVDTEVDALRGEINSAIEASGCNPLVEGLNALTAHANETTGTSDTTLSNAVQTLVAGYFGMAAIKVKNVTVPYEIYQNALIMKNWLLSVVPQSVFAVVMRDEALTDRARGNGTLFEALFMKNTPGQYIRFYNGSMTTTSIWESNYHLSADEGDKYLIFYQE